MASALSHLLFFFFLLFLPLSTTGQTGPNISLGSSLSANSENSSWVSPSGDFAFGFYPIAKGNFFLLAIWFDKIPEKTMVWLANRDNPVQQGSTAQLTKDGRLVLKDHQGRLIWEPKSINGSVSYAAMLDTGNFILSSSDSVVRWGSFDELSDTILPTQVLNFGGKLSSRLTETNYSIGRFELRFLPDGNLVLNRLALPTGNAYEAYYRSNTYLSGYQVIFNQSGYIYVLQRNQSILNLTPTSLVLTEDYYHRATLDIDGTFRQYKYPKAGASDRSGSAVWSVVWSAPDNICTAVQIRINGSGACGFNSYCSLDNDRWAVCQCPPGFSFFDESNKFKGCKPDDVVQACKLDPSRRRDLFTLWEKEDLDFPGHDYEMLDSVTEDECRDSCLDDCRCTLALFRDRSCWKKRFPLTNGRITPSSSRKSLIKVLKANYSQLLLLPEPKEKDQETTILVGSMLLGSSMFLNVAFSLVISLYVWYRYHKKSRKVQRNPNMLRSNLRSFTYRELEEATDGFKEELGRGAFGTVYKGTMQLDSMATSVAVKKLERVIEEGEKELKTEVGAIGRTHHKNLVQLLGFCNEGAHRLLVYEFMSNGSLASLLFGTSKPTWNQRLKMAFGIARGLRYLHEECSSQIIHCDVKPQNILLDDNLMAKISDFGLAKLLRTDQTRTSTGFRGTRGYVAPEWYKNMPITSKVDVYSFGVMLLEIVCCRKNVELVLGNEEKAVLTDWAYGCYRRGRLDMLLMDDRDAMEDMKRVERLVKLGIWCIQEEPSLRPCMKKVTQILEGAVEVSVPPHPSSFISSLS
ncbi:G-type lectin S-receptor-like serine/threonine-protein kinase LECRK3 [Magnolia sinica]|uniref:G-type lectin S-receptor-like serine/threonine-protein kinase LECRK3 n=1 Tax=Magnolia sinica TaxID=86752 RepID=UPI002657B0B4|nr:G-type lectin S-receptor-like serine/threonine-protein kinase LECRK3 [Magnolia sinica]